MKKEKFDLIIGRKTMYRFGMKYLKCSNEVMIKFLVGDMLCLQKKDVKKMLDYLTDVWVTEYMRKR